MEHSLTGPSNELKNLLQLYVCYKSLAPSRNNFSDVIKSKLCQSNNLKHAGENLEMDPNFWITQKDSKLKTCGISKIQKGSANACMYRDKAKQRDCTWSREDWIEDRAIPNLYTVVALSLIKHGKAQFV